MEQITGLHGKLAKKSDIFIGVGIISILFVMLVPLHTSIIDLLLVFSLLLAFVILILPVYLQRPSDFSVFPGLLLVVTLFRLSLNVATTRLILGQADAGRVIETFGSYMIKGNYVVGLIIFLILFFINFKVIVAGSQRVAEVAARFTLDAMPGKQMSVDADLNNGIINEKEAEERRDSIRRDADFYGAMDGAAKFVKGDATAGLIIMLMNIVGGIVIGIVQLKIPFSEALQRYTVLTIGDGLVSQIPSLLISTATGIIVTRAGTRSNLGEELIQQLLNEPKVLFIAGGVITLFGFAPGMPWFFFIPIGLGVIGFGYLLRKSFINEKKLAEAELEAAEVQPRQRPSDMKTYLHVDALELEIGYSLISLVDESQQGDLLDRITSLRKQIAMDVGVLVPPIRIRDNISLVPNQYIIKIRGEQIASGECLINHYLALDAGSVEKPVKGIATRDPAFGLAALWISEDKKEIAEMHGYSVIEPAAMIATHLSEVIRNNADTIITRQDVQNLLENIKKHNAAVVEELVPKYLSLGNVEQVLKNLLHENVPIRDMVTVLETLADYAPVTRDVDTLTEYVRFALARTISRRFIAGDGVVYGITLAPQLEQILTDVVRQRREKGASASIQPEILNMIIADLQEAITEMNKQDLQPVVMVSPMIRKYLHEIIEQFIPTLPVISVNEIPPNIEIRAQITLEMAS
ncbi:MAG: flagellar biosynthesis protein FlhA [Candidatus Cloacimonetes bacterium]|nr:flagellar biosynthesis protein FlhA [Candidatus Cloacimonadota bacterium]